MYNKFRLKHPFPVNTAASFALPTLYDHRFLCRTWTH